MSSWVEPKLTSTFVHVAAVLSDLSSILNISYHIETGSLYVNDCRYPRRWSLSNLFACTPQHSNIFNLIVTSGKKIPPWFYDRYNDGDYVWLDQVGENPSEDSREDDDLIEYSS